MRDHLLDPGGVVIPPSALDLPRAKQLAELLARGRLDYVEMVEARQCSGPAGETSQIVVMKVEVERPQKLTHPIHRFEWVAAKFSADDASYPDVCSLRPDFPKVPHLNLRTAEFPRSLCLYEQPWNEVALRWTPTTFVERIRYWLAETARGSLHQTDQPLEPLLFGSGYRIVLPVDLFAVAGETTELLDVRFAAAGDDARVLIATRPPADNTKRKLTLDYIATTLTAKPQQHGLIRHAPSNLAELDRMLSPAGIELLSVLRDRADGWKEAGHADRRLIVLVAFPMTRDGQDTVESTDIWCFFTASNVREVGLALGVWEDRGGKLAWVMVRDPDADGRTVGLDVMAPHFDVSRSSAAAASGVEPDVTRIVAVGVGSLGSQVAMTLVRSGFGRWTFVDDDVVLPHNLARHSVTRAGVGHTKAICLAVEAGRIYEGTEAPIWIPADVLDPGEYREKLDARFAEAELILDMAASVPASRHLAHGVTSAARRVALFLNPRGCDLVLLAEDRSRSIPLDVLEMMYLWAVAERDELSNHLAAPEGKLRYSRSCRDVSFSVPNHLVTLHAAVGAHAVRTSADEDGARASVWRADPQSLAVIRVDLPVSGVRRTRHGGWELVVCEELLGRLVSLRQSRLPNETGGVLIGAYDLSRRIIYVVGTIPSPPDSRERPTLYIRGCDGLADRVADIGRKTDGQLEYVGEWHSHPDGYRCDPSDKDLQVFEWLAAHMEDAGLPALMAIVGQGGESAWFVGEISRTGGGRWTC